ncbi:MULTISPECIES: pentapeptide repeat-containing protein [Catenuloplanes]|uniref:Uncharacterized protein YjbI with pentapeptide repeats n=1 Tax=Catenuloplanes niger TaxID=587534 RepID=A0AAE4CTW1_9ACTN|nr:pentapeptide repeat-containing protein [Catenuloplanes niger]MDR7321119.1 uncharacterized protein YjbI with pentapeptide repeats [Catenuloplanes niger]
MTDKIDEYVNGVFAPYEGARSVGDLKRDLLADLHERFRELRAEGKDEATALALTIDSIGDIEQTVREVSNLSRVLERQTVTRFDGTDSAGGDFAGVITRNGRFDGSALRGADFSHADLTGSTFRGSDVAEANFDGANLTDVTMTASEFTRATFRGAILVRTDFSTSGLNDIVIADSALTDVKFRSTDVRRVVFERCTFTGVDFTYSDLRKLSFDGAALTSVRFDRAGLEGASFRGAILRDVSFRAWSRKYRNALRTVDFTGARMDKLTYAGLKGYGLAPADVIVE